MWYFVEHPRISYRPDLDGLRAIAVLSVIACHAGLGLPGGYVGVDVFFVISGYLISSLILKDIRQGTFSLADFWERRIRRILPALLVVTVATLVVGWFALIPDDYALLGRSVVALALLGSNIHFWRNTGYFAPSAEEIPLLHTWSLAVEEQFYLFVPVFLILIARAKRLHRAMLLLAVTAFTSFVLSIYGEVRHPIATFYLLPTRAWELFAGAFLAFLPDGQFRRSRRLKGVGAILGLPLIIIPCIVYSQSTRFPGLAALPPVVGAILLIWSGITPERPLANRCLAWRPLVFIGLISYSLYLWHWPVFVFARLYSIHGIRWLERLLLVAATLLLALASWRYIELPFRGRRLVASRRRLLVVTGLAFFGLLGGGLLIDRKGGFVHRMPSDALQFAASSRHDLRYSFNHDVEDVPSKLARFGANASPAEILVWGDSHAMAVLPAFEAISNEQGIDTVAAVHVNTPPVLNYVYVDSSRFGLSERSVPYNAAVLDMVLRSRSLRTVVLVARWSYYFVNAEFEGALLRSIDVLRDGGINVYFMIDVPAYGFDVPKTLARCRLWGRNPHDLALLVDDYKVANPFYASLLPKLADRAVRILDPIPTLQTQAHAEPNSILPFDPQGSFYRDKDHLSTHGAMAIKQLFLPCFKR